MLRLTDISHHYGQTPVLDRVSLELPKGRVICLVGPSGCGKTTLLHIAAGLFPPSGGEVTNHFRRIAVVFQEPRLLPWRNTRDNIAFGLKAHGVVRAERRGIAERLGARLGLDEALDRYPHQLSGGMRQRAALGRALAVEPELLLLDEPFSALDVGLRRDLQNLFLELIAERGLAALFVTHDLTEAVRIGDEVMVLTPAPGRVVEHWQQSRSAPQRDPVYVYETVAHLLRVPAVADAFHVAARGERVFIPRRPYAEPS
ncbi:MAG: ABC transporter ATP-binding protein [Oscillochloridaceae bacterium]|nr:ABC transporter ATP-binding protein [Chloroflexaceae bacterium]MDW8389656.1 ABC transporter ATP-binding protein [Oscillochloridaceae bacterium]